MKIKSVTYELKAGQPGEFPSGIIPEIAFAGRSNVGKSSLINTLIRRKNLAKTGSTPGKTRAIYFYLVNKELFLVDLPGYGFAKVSKNLRQIWGELMGSYLANREQLKACIQIVDIRHPPQELDKQMSDWLMYSEVPFMVVATKGDKISRGRYKKSLEDFRNGLSLNDGVPVISFSSQTSDGKDEVWKFIREVNEN